MKFSFELAYTFSDLLSQLFSFFQFYRTLNVIGLNDENSRDPNISFSKFDKMVKIDSRLQRDFSLHDTSKSLSETFRNL